MPCFEAVRIKIFFHYNIFVLISIFLSVNFYDTRKDHFRFVQDGLLYCNTSLRRLVYLFQTFTCLTLMEVPRYRIRSKYIFDTARIMSVFRVFLVRTFPNLDIIRRFNEVNRIISPYSVRMRENTDKSPCSYAV